MVGGQVQATVSLGDQRIDFDPAEKETATATPCPSLARARRPRETIHVRTYVYVHGLAHVIGILARNYRPDDTPN